MSSQSDVSESQADVSESQADVSESQADVSESQADVSESQGVEEDNYDIWDRPGFSQEVVLGGDTDEEAPSTPPSYAPTELVGIDPGLQAEIAGTFWFVLCFSHWLIVFPAQALQKANIAGQPAASLEALDLTTVPRVPRPGSMLNGLAPAMGLSEYPDVFRGITVRLFFPFTLSIPDFHFQSDIKRTALGLNLDYNVHWNDQDHVRLAQLYVLVSPFCLYM
jgi:hypothetical protein